MTFWVRQLFKGGNYSRKYSTCKKKKHKILQISLLIFVKTFISYLLILLKGTLKVHISVVHEKKKPFMCDLCGSSFAKRPKLKSHYEIVHEGIKRHKCSICSARFSNTHNMRCHIASAHDKKKLYQCSLCSDSFSRKENLTSHIASVHSWIVKQQRFFKVSCIQSHHLQWKFKLCAGNFASGV